VQTIKKERDTLTNENRILREKSQPELLRELQEQREYCLAYQGLIGNVFNPQSLERAVALGAKASISITVKRVVISGELISINEFHEGMTNIMFDALERSNNKDEGIRIIRDIVMEMKGVYENPDPEFRLLVDSYVCIKDPLFVLGGGGSLRSPGQFWIGKIKSVDGFMLGTTEGDETKLPINY